MVRRGCLKGYSLIFMPPSPPVSVRVLPAQGGKKPPELQICGWHWCKSTLKGLSSFFNWGGGDELLI